MNFTNFNNDIAAAFLNFEHLDLNSLVSYFNLMLSLLLDKYTLEKTVHTTTSSYNPWFLSNLLHERYSRRQLEHTWHRSHSNNDRLLYRTQFQLLFTNIES